MQRRRPVGKWIALCCGGLAALVVVLALAGYGVVSAVGGRRAQRALARVKASGAPTTWAEVIPPPVPDDENAALLYQKAFATMSAGTHWGELASYAYWTFRKTPLIASRGVTGDLAANALALSYAAEAARRPRCRFNRDWTDPLAGRYGTGWLGDRFVMTVGEEWGPQQLEDSRPELYRLRNLAALVSAQGVFQARRGDVEGGFAVWRINVAMVKHLGADPTLQGQQTRYHIVDTAAKSLWWMLQAGQPRLNACRAATRDLAQLDMNGALTRMLQAEMIVGLYHLREAARDRGVAASFADEIPGAPPYSAGRLAEAQRSLRGFGYRFIAPLDRAAFVQTWTDRSARMRQPYYKPAARFGGLTRPIPRYDIVTRALREVPEACARARDEAMAEIGLMRTALGLAAYRAQHGGYPASLDVLRQALKWEVPEDPFSGWDFFYRRERAGYVLYSVGHDRADEGGTDPDLFIYGRDIVWRVNR